MIGLAGSMTREQVEDLAAEITRAAGGLRRIGKRGMGKAEDVAAVAEMLGRAGDQVKGLAEYLMAERHEIEQRAANGLIRSADVLR